MVIQETHTETKCDNPECPVSYKWIEEEARKDPEVIPDPFFRFLIVAGVTSGKWTFCGKYCLLEWLKTYKPPQSPREQRLAVEAKAKEIAEIEAETKRVAELAEGVS